MLIVFVVIMPLLAHQKDTIHWAVDYFVLMPRNLLRVISHDIWLNLFHHILLPSLQHYRNFLL